jgi:ribosome modulation factor
VRELVQAIDRAWPTPKVAPRKRALPAVPFEPSAWVSKLRQARDDSAMFQSLLQELTKSKQLKTAEVIAIANGFRSTSKSYRSRSAAVEDVRKAWLEGQRDATKVRNVGGIF